MDEAASPKKALALYLLPVLFLVYFLVGAISGEISVPGRNDILSIQGISAWLACGFPALWLASEIIRHEQGINLSANSRKILAPIIMVVGVGIFFYAIYKM